MNLGTNIEAEVSGNILTLSIDLSQTHGKSGSGKSTIIATTAGNRTIEHGEEEVKIGVNIYKK